MKRVLVAVTWICATAAVRAQEWTLETPSVAPPGRIFHGMSAGYTAASKILLFGGMDWTGYVPSALGDTWEWNGSTWTQRFPATSPAARWFAAQTALGTSGITLLFGGGDGYQRHYDTWSWDGINWTLRDPGGAPGISSPGAYYLAMMCYDSRRNRAVLFGGSDPYLVAETWEWNDAAGTWTHVLTPQSPPPTAQGYFAYDRRRGVCVLFGGDVSSNTKTSDTWEYDGTTWRPVATHNRPPASSGQNNMAFDLARGRIVTYLGSRGHWEYDGVDWYRVFPLNDPGSSWQRSAAYHAGTSRYVMFSGGFTQPQSDTWTYGGFAAHFETYGHACAGSAGLPELSPRRNSLPALGREFGIVLRNVSPAGVLLVVAGVPSPAPPLDLTSAGMPGCFLYPDPNGMLLFPATLSGAVARFTLPIPSHPAIAGLRFELQGLQIEFAGASTSNVGRATIR